MQFNSTDRVANLIYNRPFAFQGSPSDEQSAYYRKQEVPATERRFQNPPPAKRLIFGITSKVEDEIDNCRTSEDRATRFAPPLCSQCFDSGSYFWGAGYMDILKYFKFELRR